MVWNRMLDKREKDAFCQELHASMVAADVEDVAQALLRHLECQEPTKEQLE